MEQIEFIANREIYEKVILEIVQTETKFLMAGTSDVF